MLGEVQEFLTGVRRPRPDRVLATILFTDIIGSTRPPRASVTTVGATSRTSRRSSSDVNSSASAATRSTLRATVPRVLRRAGTGFAARRAIADSVTAPRAPIRAGLHTGECEVDRRELAGIAVHIAARVAALAEPGEVLVSERSGTSWSVHDVVSRPTGCTRSRESRRVADLRGRGGRAGLRDARGLAGRCPPTQSGTSRRKLSPPPPPPPSR